MRCCDNCFNGHYILQDNGEILTCDNNTCTEVEVAPQDTCEYHRYLSGYEEEKNYLFYDESYLGPGYFIINCFGNEIIKFIKIYKNNNTGFDNYGIRVFKVNNVDNPDDKFNMISFTFRDEEDVVNNLYDIFVDFWHNLKICYISSIDKNNHGDNYINTTFNGQVVKLDFYKDIYNGTQHPSDYIDILIGDNLTFESYYAFQKLFSDLAMAHPNIDEDEIKQLILLKK